eukprot:m.176929 g.176929  ORF g.176929 m.176929 type:complete len:581 (+) comp14252_c0_seq1:36-1778(+)
MKAAMAMALVAVASTPVTAVPNGLGRTPPLAWSSWNYFAFEINETIALEIGDALIATGLADLGYKYVNIDAGSFNGTRDPTTGKILPVESKYPHGMKWLADQLHQKGLLFGVYTDISLHTCGGSGSMGHYEIDAQTYAEWEVDYLKVDFCGPTTGPTDPAAGRVSVQAGPQYDAWNAFGEALNKTGRPIYYSICPHRVVEKGQGLPGVWDGRMAYAPPPEWTAEQRYNLANSILVEYVNTYDEWYRGPGQGGIISDIDAMIELTNLSYSGPGSWNDADMLQLCTYGKGGTVHSTNGMTLSEYRAHYSVWAILASPLILSADIRNVKEEHPDCLDLMLNAEIVAVNQDPLGNPGRFISQTTNGTTIGSGIRVAPCNAPDSGSVLWTPQADHSIRVGPNSTMCLDAYNCGTADGTPVELFTCHPNGTAECGYTNQQWTLNKDGTITNINSKTCLTVNGTSTVLEQCVAGNKMQQMSLVDGVMHVGGAEGTMCLVVDNAPASAQITSQIFARSLQNDETAVVLLNRDETPTKLTVSWADLGLEPTATFAVRDVINKKDLGHMTGEYSAVVGKHDVAFIRLAPV